MLKICKFFAGVLALVLLLTGCAGNEAPVTQPAPTQNAQQITSLSLGAQMPELTVTTAQGETLLLSELLQQKKMVVLNFWFADCIWCIREFPVMEVAYQRFREDVEILALSPYDNASTITEFQLDHSLSFPMSSCDRDLPMAFGIGSYPTSVVIDREGRICLIHSGAITDVTVFNKLFATFTAEDYTSRAYHSINDLL